MKRYITLSSYAKLSGLGLPAVSIRLKNSFEGVYNEDDPRYLELTEIEIAEGFFIDTTKYPPKRFNQKRK